MDRFWTTSLGVEIKDSEYRITIDEGEDYVITRDRNFIANHCGESIVSTFIKSACGCYIRPEHIGENYTLKEGETDLYEFVIEHFQEYI